MLVLDAAPVRYARGTVGAFAVELRKTPDALLEQLREAGVDKAAPTDSLCDEDKRQLLAFLQANHGSASPERKRITLTKSDRRAPPTESDESAVIQVGGLGRIAYAEADAAGKSLLDAFQRLQKLIAEFYEHRSQDFDAYDFGSVYREAFRRMNETLKQLRKLVKRVARPAGAVVRSATRVQRHGGAFFHALKVDGRNLP